MNAGVDRVRDVLTELVKAALVSEDGLSLAFRNAAAAGLAALRDDPPDPARLRMDGAWTLAVRAAEAPALQPMEGRVNLTLPQHSPFTLDALLAPGFDVDAAVERVRKAASTG